MQTKSVNLGNERGRIVAQLSPVGVWCDAYDEIAAHTAAAAVPEVLIYCQIIDNATSLIN